MKVITIGIGLSLCAMYTLPSVAATAQESAAPTERILIELEHEEVDQYRLELFDSDGFRVHDTGLVKGAIALHLDSETRSRIADLRYEVRGWDGAGELVFSQLSSLNGDELFSIDFDVIPDGTSMTGAEGRPAPLDRNCAILVPGSTRS